MNKSPSSEPILLDSKEVANLLGVSHTTIWRMRCEGRLPAPIQVSSRLVKWRRSDILDWVDQQAKSAQ